MCSHDAAVAVAGDANAKIKLKAIFHEIQFQATTLKIANNSIEFWSHTDYITENHQWLELSHAEFAHLQQLIFKVTCTADSFLNKNSTEKREK